MNVRHWSGKPRGHILSTHHSDSLHVFKREGQQTLPGQRHGRLCELGFLVALRGLEPAPKALRGGEARI